MASLVLKNGGTPGTEYSLLDGLNRVGRSPTCEISLQEASLSAVHCELWLMSERLLVRDLGSTNGTFVNGKPASEAELGENDLLALGGVEFVVRGVPGQVRIPQAEVAPPPPRFTPDGFPCCVNHSTVRAEFRCPRCSEQFCADCVRILGRRGGTQHAYCPLCNAECTRVPASRNADRDGGASSGWLNKLTKTLRLRP